MKTDIWGNLIVWLPIAIPQTLNPIGRSSYTVIESDIKDARSLAQLAGTPIHIFHPNHRSSRSPVISPNNSEGVIGVALGGKDNIRNRSDGGVEVKVKITDQGAMNRILSGELTEVSAGYTIHEGFRQYNHLALVPPGYAVNGRGMTIQLESNIITTKMNETEIKTLATAVMEALMSHMAKEECTEAENAMKLESLTKAAYDSAIADAKYILIAESNDIKAKDAKDAKAQLIIKAFPAHTDETTAALTLESLNALVDVALPLLSSAKTNESEVKKVAKTAAVVLESNSSADEDMKEKIRNRFASKR